MNYGGVAVSYTHLDVYKRQKLNIIQIQVNYNPKSINKEPIEINTSHNTVFKNGRNWKQL